MQNRDLLRLLAAAMLLAAVVACSPAAPSPPPSASPPPVQGEITVFAASSLTDAFREIGERFQSAYPGTKVSFNFGASIQLRTQLEQGARADVFASADQPQMDRAKQAGVISDSDRTFARNRLAVIVSVHTPSIAQLPDLAKPGLKLVTAAPEVPIGVYTQDVLEKLSRAPAYGADFKSRVNANVVSQEPNVRQAVAKVSLGEADAAVVYATDITSDTAANVRLVEIPEAFNTIAVYPIAAVRDGTNPVGSAAFIAYVVGNEGQAVLRKWGFLPPDAAVP